MLQGFYTISWHRGQNAVTKRVVVRGLENLLMSVGCSIVDPFGPTIQRRDSLNLWRGTIGRVPSPSHHFGFGIVVCVFFLSRASLRKVHLMIWRVVLVVGVDRASRPYESSLPLPDLRTC